MEEKKIVTFIEVPIEAYDSYFSEDCSVFLTGRYYGFNVPSALHHTVKSWVAAYQGCKVGLIAACTQGVLHSPFMTSYGGFRVEGILSSSKMELFVKALVEASYALSLESIRLILPPDVLDQNMALTAALLRYQGFHLEHLELNHYFELQQFTEAMDYLSKKDKKNTAHALKRGMRCRLLEDMQEKHEVYKLFQRSRAQRNIPLKMSWEKLQEVMLFVSVDVWGTYTSTDELCAGAVVYRINSEVMQVVYWGFAPEHATLDAMRYLSFCLFKHYKALGLKYIDIGISTEQGILNKGLVAFKESIGCKACHRMEFVRELRS